MITKSCSTTDTHLTMTSPSKGERFKAATVDFKKRFRLADPIILQGIDDFVSVIAREELAFSWKGRGGIVYGRRSIISIFCDLFDPLLAQLKSQSPRLSAELEFNDISLPLANRLTSLDDCNFYAFKFRSSTAHFDYLGEHSSEPRGEIIRNGESLNAIAEILQIIISTIQTDRITWCKFCFRRANVNSDYCQTHHLRKSSPEDTNYRIANRVYKSLDNAAIKMREKHRSRRRYCGESFLLMADKSPAKNIELGETYLIISEEMMATVEAVRKRPWTEIAPDWNDAICLLPEISQRFTQPAETFASWDDFVSALFHALEEPIETTRHPVWVIDILKDAETWLTAERENSDRRTNGTRSKVLALAQQGASDAEIATQLGSTKKYIAEILRNSGGSN